jgi:very-short-patch-repair endonuclease
MGEEFLQQAEQQPEILNVELCPKINVACHQNNIAVLKSLSLSNVEERLIENATLTLTSQPEFFKPKVWTIECLGSGDTIHIRDRDLQLNGGLLLDLKEAVKGHIEFLFEHQGKILASGTLAVELLACNEWGGTDYMPELLAAFVMPNASGIDRLLGQCSQLLKNAHKPSELDGYRSNSSKRVWEVASSIYSAVSNYQLSYSIPPASFEKNGQKIRMPEQILQDKIATCLDISLLFASAFEQAGLNPVIVLQKGHAFAGVWLRPEKFSTVLTDDAESVRKRLQLKELLVFETTCVTQAIVPPFSKAVEKAHSMLAQECDSAFETALDIKRARDHQIRPLGFGQKLILQGDTREDTLQVSQTLEEAPDLPDFSEEVANEDLLTPQGRLQQWKTRLLNLSLTNPLLNYKSSKSSLKILCPEPACMEDMLSAKKKFSLVSAQKLLKTRADGEIYQIRTGDTLWMEQAKEALGNNQLLVDATEEELEKSLVEIYRKTKTALEEGGANTLYLAVGFLLWRSKDKKDDKVHRSPLILLPVSLERSSVRSGVKLLAHEEDPRFNTTLLELLKHDFEIHLPGLNEELPQDDNGVDVTAVWNRVRQAVKEVPGFEVVEDVALGHFSFVKYLMWKDLMERSDKLQASPIVAHLINTPRERYGSHVSFVDPVQLDTTYKPSDFFAPLPADSSQLAVLAAAEKGKDFVIVGPPGTGKSQTIANLITHLMANGKRVLFVSEKMAALEVVYRRLSQVGIGQFCLQLHSNKASKTDVLNQLNVAWENSGQKTREEWENTAENLQQLRDELNVVVKALHKEASNGLTPYDAMGIKIRDEDLASSVQLSWASAHRHSKQELKDLKELVGQLQIQAQACQSYLENRTFSDVSNGDWSPPWQQKITASAEHLLMSLESYMKTQKQFMEASGIALSVETFAQVDVLAELAEILKEARIYQADYAFSPGGPEQIEALEKAVQHLKGYISAKDALSCDYEADAWKKLDGAELSRQWHEILNQSFFAWPPKFWKKHQILKHMKQSGARGKPAMPNDALFLEELRSHGEALDSLDSVLSDLRVWKKENTPVSEADGLQLIGTKLRVVTAKLAPDMETLSQLRERLKLLLKEGRELLTADGQVGLQADSLITASHALKSAWSDLSKLCRKACKQEQEEVLLQDKSLIEMKMFASTLLERKNELRAWCDWQRISQQAVEQELKPLVDAIEKGSVEIRDVEKAFFAAYCQWWSQMIISEDETLKRFSSAQHSAKINRFRKLDETFQKLTASCVHAKLASSIPDPRSQEHSKEWGILQREIQKKRRHKAVRQLIQEIPNVIHKLAPCLMMSPLSIAQYLPVSQELFDVVIFDEASQITVWDAIGALSRGKQVIVAGDPKQMPPSNFFNRSVGSNEDLGSDTEEDLESILDELIGASVPTLRLNWHYRSRCESLIAFSNMRYYDQSLVTFPAPETLQKSVHLKKVKGQYARAASRTNEPEAKLVVAECVKRLTHPDEAVRKKSIGIVTFNAEQQRLIADLLDVERGKNPLVEAGFSQDRDEPVFIKNLETVQGDERDVILFSITYGPDLSNKITMNFGPLNKTGGERRLNVALTRARQEMIIFASLSPEQIDLTRTSARAVEDLKHFLQYAEQGKSVLGNFASATNGDFESPFEQEVAHALRDKGWTIHPQVGISAFRIDLGVVHPSYPGAYLAGVECDGATYHRSATARDRDRIRQSVLEGLGWKLLRVWSTDWWTNKSAAIKSLDEALHEVLKLTATGQYNDKNESINTTEPIVFQG